MVSTPKLTPRRSLAALGQEALTRVVNSGLLRCGVPRSLGGDGASLTELAAGVQAMAAHNRAAAWVLWSQRLAIEALVHTRNAGLRDYVLPDLLVGERAGALPMPMQQGALMALDAGRGLRLYGQLPCVPNLQHQGFALVAPVQLEQGPPQWVLLRSEEDGLRVGMDLDAPCPSGSRTASLVLDGVFFRMDEWLGDADLPVLLQPVAQALQPAKAAV